MNKNTWKFSEPEAAVHFQVWAYPYMSKTELKSRWTVPLKISDTITWLANRYSSARSWIRIRIRTKIFSWIRIRNFSKRIRNTGVSNRSLVLEINTRSYSRVSTS